GGGMDLKFPHHECEIAQNIGACNEEPVNYWMHSNMLNFNGQKMSKSLGNSILPLELVTGNHPLLDKAYSPMVVRLLFLQSHYASELDINIKSLQDAEKNLRKLLNAANFLQEITQSGAIKPDIDIENQIHQLCLGCKEAMDDDFNTAKTVANLLGLVTHINTYYNNGKTANNISVDVYNSLQKYYIEYLFDILGLKNETQNADGTNETLDKVMNLVIDIRKQARENKDWTTSDKIRDALKDAKINIKDNKDGTTYELI
ncbi:MAG TPA: cysteine--tRNA ligase, partial [Chitinophagales bacterium]|nr:cysteine--tRNA ligase [Chitinophagales bacterium]